MRDARSRSLLLAQLGTVPSTSSPASLPAQHSQTPSRHNSTALLLSAFSQSMGHQLFFSQQMMPSHNLGWYFGTEYIYFIKVYVLLANVLFPANKNAKSQSCSVGRPLLPMIMMTIVLAFWAFYHIFDKVKIFCNFSESSMNRSFWIFGMSCRMKWIGHKVHI